MMTVLPAVPAAHPFGTTTRGWMIILALLCALISGPLQVLARAPATPPAGTPASSLMLDAIQPDMRDTVLAAVPDTLPTYQISAVLDTEGPSSRDPEIRGTLHLTWINTTGESLDALPFRLYANGPDREHDALVVDDVTVDGTSATPALSVANSVLTIPFPEPLEDGSAMRIDLAFVATIPVDSTSHYGIFGANSRAGTLAMAHWYPVVAGRDPVTGWVLDPPSRNGDPIFSDIALYDVSVRARPQFEVVATGIEESASPVDAEGVTAHRFVSGPVRDFTLVADENLDVATRDVNGLTVNSWFNAGQDRVGNAVADVAAQTVAMFEDLLGPYPYRELDLVSVELNGAAGVEFPQLLYIGLDYYQDGQPLDEPNGLEFTVAHEVIHQWFYGLVGNDQYQHAFIDEGLTNFLSAQIYFERRYDNAAAAKIVDRYIGAPFASAVRANNDEIVDQLTDEFSTERDYVYAVYSKAPLGFRAIRNEIGDDAFFAGLQAYVTAFTFRTATPDALRHAFEDSSGKVLDELWRHWFEAAEGKQDVPA